MLKSASGKLITSTIHSGSVYHCLTKNVGYETEANHFFIVINKNPLTDAKIYLCWFSTKVKEIKALRCGNIFRGTLIEVSPSDYSELSQPSIIDCNKVEERSLEEIIKTHKVGNLDIKKDLPEVFLDKIWDAVQNSPTVRDRIKDQLI
jgi:hypothetical protein